MLGNNQPLLMSAVLLHLCPIIDRFAVFCEQLLLVYNKTKTVNMHVFTTPIETHKMTEVVYFF